MLVVSDVGKHECLFKNKEKEIMLAFRDVEKNETLKKIYILVRFVLLKNMSSTTSCR